MVLQSANTWQTFLRQHSVSDIHPVRAQNFNWNHFLTWSRKSMQWKRKRTSQTSFPGKVLSKGNTCSKRFTIPLRPLLYGCDRFPKFWPALDKNDLGKVYHPEILNFSPVCPLHPKTSNDNLLSNHESAEKSVQKLSIKNPSTLRPTCYFSISIPRFRVLSKGYENVSRYNFATDRCILAAAGYHHRDLHKKPPPGIVDRIRQSAMELSTKGVGFCPILGSGIFQINQSQGFCVSL